MLSDTKPFRIAGNLYFVGLHKESCHILKTTEGLLMIDCGYDKDVEIILDSMNILGLSPKEVKKIFLSHGHLDHTGGAKRMKEITGAEVWMGEEDMKYIRSAGFVPDRYFEDGMQISLGETTVTCLHTPGHTEGVYSFFFDLEENGVIYRAGMFGGAGTNQLKKAYLNRPDRRVSYLMRGEFFKTLERLKNIHVDIPVGNHVATINQDEKYARMENSKINPFISPDEWVNKLNELGERVNKIMADETRSEFITYAHRGASEYNPENTMMSFYEGVRMGANGIETDVQITKDGIPVLFHDDTLLRVTGEQGTIADYTLEELNRFTVKKDGLFDRIPMFEEFLKAFSWRDLTFAIELKKENTENRVNELIHKYGIENKCVVTSFTFENLKRMRQIDPLLRTGWLKLDFSPEDIQTAKETGIDELCPKAISVTPEKVAYWHSLGFNVRAWGVVNEDLMRAAYEAHVDGMTVNFPDKLIELIKKENETT